MRCPEFSGLLSAYHDGELPTDREAAVANHIAHCPGCAAELTSLRKLSQMAAKLDEPLPTRGVWRSIETRLDTDFDEISRQSNNRPRKSRRTMLAALSLLVLAVLSGAYFVLTTHDNHHVAVNLGPFIDLFEQAPNDAQNYLLASYNGRRVTLEEAVKELKYKPVATYEMPSEYDLSDASLLKMPCCVCLEVCWVRKQGGMVCIFEHERDQFVQFGGREVSSTVCGGTPTRVVHMDGRLTATWQQNGRFITVVGAKDVEEISNLMRHFKPSERVPPG